MSIGADKSVYVWNLDEREMVAKWEGQATEVTLAAYHDDNNLVVTGDIGGTMIFWNVVTGKAQRIVSGHVGRVTGLAFHRNNQQLISSGQYGM